MENAMVAGLPAFSFDPAHIHREAFGVPVVATGIEATISFRGRNFAYAGECGECRLTVTQGRTRNLLTGEEDSRSTLACCSVPMGDLGLAE